MGKIMDSKIIFFGGHGRFGRVRKRAGSANVPVGLSNPRCRGGPRRSRAVAPPVSAVCDYERRAGRKMGKVMDSKIIF
jgi:hypothetical protein